MTIPSLNLALFGLGRAGHFHLQSIRATPGLRLRYVFDVDPQRAQGVAEEFDGTLARTPERAWADPDVDAVIVATPTQTHYGYIEASLKAGKAVFSEKPLGVTLPEIDQCFALARARNRPLFVGFMRRFDPSFATLTTQVHQGEIGPVHFIRTTSRDAPLPSIDYIRTSHGIFHDCIVHDLDMIGCIMREPPAEVFAFGSNFIPAIQAVEDLDTVLVALRFPSGALGSIDVSRHAAYGYDQRIEVFGRDGMVQAENRTPTSTLLSRAAGVARPNIEPSFPSRYREAYRIELETFRDCVLDEKPVPITHQEVRINYLLAESAERSFREGRPVKVDPTVGVTYG